MDKNQKLFIQFFKKWVSDNWKGTRTELSEFLGVSYSHVSNILNGNKGGHETTRIKICNKLGVDYRSLIICDVTESTTSTDNTDGIVTLAGEPLPPPGRAPGQPDQPHKPAPNHNLIVQVSSQTEKEFLNGITDLYRGIPLYESGRLAAGINGIEFYPYESPASMVLVYKPELQGCSRHKLAAVKVGSESMEPAIIKGSIVVVDLSDREQIEGKVYVVNTPEGGMDMASVKRVRKWKEGFVLLSDNPKFSPEPTSLDWNRLCVGRVVWMWRDTRNI